MAHMQVSICLYKSQLVLESVCTVYLSWIDCVTNMRDTPIYVSNSVQPKRLDTPTHFYSLDRIYTQAL